MRTSYKYRPFPHGNDSLSGGWSSIDLSSHDSPTLCACRTLNGVDDEVEGVVCAGGMNRLGLLVGGPIGSLILTFNRSARLRGGANLAVLANPAGGVARPLVVLCV